jgi:hypothetical protein
MWLVAACLPTGPKAPVSTSSTWVSTPDSATGDSAPVCEGTLGTGEIASCETYNDHLPIAQEDIDFFLACCDCSPRYCDGPLPDCPAGVTNFDVRSCWETTATAQDLYSYLTAGSGLVTAVGAWPPALPGSVNPWTDDPCDGADYDHAVRVALDSGEALTVGWQYPGGPDPAVAVGDRVDVSFLESGAWAHNGAFTLRAGGLLAFLYEWNWVLDDAERGLAIERGTDRHVCWEPDQREVLSVIVDGTTLVPPADVPVIVDGAPMRFVMPYSVGTSTSEQNRFSDWFLVPP